MKKYLLFPAVVIATMLANCGKTYDPQPEPEPAGNYNIVEVMASLAPKPKTVTLDAVTGGSFRGNSGTRYEFPANAFRTATGAPVTGNVEVTVNEFLNKADMLFSGVLPMSNGEPLISGGEIEVTATQGGQPLQVAPGTAYKANMPMPGTDATGMTLFSGERSGSTVNWMPADTGGSKLNGLYSAGDTIGLSATGTRFSNADRFITNPNYQQFTITVNLGGTMLSSDSFFVAAFLDNLIGILGVSGHGAKDNVYSVTNVPNVPVHFVIFGTIKGNFYGGILGATPTTGSNYTVNAQKTTPQAFKAQVAALK